VEEGPQGSLLVASRTLTYEDENKCKLREKQIENAFYAVEKQQNLANLSIRIIVGQIFHSSSNSSYIDLYIGRLLAAGHLEIKCDKFII
jgi:hypothetical protein